MRGKETYGHPTAKPEYYDAGLARLADVRAETTGAHSAVAPPTLYEMVLLPVPSEYRVGRRPRLTPPRREMPVPGVMWGFGEPSEEIRIEEEVEVRNVEQPNFCEGEALED